MAVKYGFFDAAYDEQTGTYDRQYLSDDMSKYFDAIVGNGVFKNEGDALEVIPSGDGMSVVVSAGFATARGRYLYNTEPYTIELEDSSSYPRIDIIVARMSTFQNERDFKLIVRTGTPAPLPVVPSIVRNEGIYELCLAKINVSANVSSITSEMIEDTRDDEELCGFVSGLGGGAEFIDCIINTGVDTYSSAWLLDKDGNEFQPEDKKVYRVISDGKYCNCIYLFNEETNLYEGVGSYNIELTDEEAVAIWNSAPSIRLENIPAPVSDIQYNGSEISPTWLYYDPTKLRIGGVVSAKNAGTYYATFEPINGYCWSDGTVSVKSIAWSIIKKIVPIPIPMQTRFNYDGTIKTVVFNNLDTNSVTITNASATNMGTYTVTATLNDSLNTIWSDETYVQRAWEFNIAGMQNLVTLSKDNVTLDSDSDSDTISVSSSSGGEISVESSNEGIAHAEVNGSVITVTHGDSPFKGEAEILVTVSGSSIYEPGTAIISVKKDYGLSIVSWADGTDEEIAAMVQAADEGIIDLHDYWDVGDERTISLSAMNASGSNTYGSWNVGESHVAQDVTLVLMDTDHYELETSVLDKDGNERTRCSFVVGCKNALLEQGYIDNNSSNYVFWDTSKRRNWCNAAFAGAISSDLIPAFKRFKVGTGKSTNSSQNIIDYTNDLFSLFAEKEVLGDAASWSHIIERNALDQIEWYKTLDNRKKIAGDDTSANIVYWNRSPEIRNSMASMYVTIASTGESSTRINKYANSYLSPFGVI